MPDAYELLPELDPMNPVHRCVRCGECWAWRSVQVQLGCLVKVSCVNGHRASVLLFDLPDLQLSEAER